MTREVPDASAALSDESTCIVPRASNTEQLVDRGVVRTQRTITRVSRALNNRLLPDPASVDEVVA
jgi:hypothetical protein